MSESIRSKKWGRKNSAAGTSRSYTRESLKSLALFYCSKRETSRPKLQAYLARKAKAQPEAKDWIESILLEFERLKVIDHERYAGMLNREYSRRGKGKRYIQQKLKERGVSEQIASLEFTPEDELERATAEASKALTKTAFKKITEPHLQKQKLLMKMVTLGFDYSVAKMAVEVALRKE